MKQNAVPASLEAKTKQQLRLLMMATNRRYGKRFHYFDFCYADGKWHCWFELNEIDRVEKDGARGVNDDK